jgi:hypothetical protein
MSGRPFKKGHFNTLLDLARENVNRMAMDRPIGRAMHADYASLPSMFIFDPLRLRQERKMLPVLG